MSWGYYSYYPPYVSVAQRRAKAAKEVAKLAKKGQKISPVKIDGRTIARTFWGKAWCDNLESYSDFSNRMPRGRSYVRNGSVCDLQIEPGKVTALVCGSELYRITIKIKPLPAATWKAVKAECAGQIGSLVELLQGKLSKGVMEVVTRKDGGLFPKPNEIELDCSCPDWADMCKHVAASLYGIGARLDERPELLFELREVDHLELIAGAGDAAALGKPAAGGKTIAAGDLADVFGIELDEPAAPVAPAPATPVPPAPATAMPRKSKAGVNKTASKAASKSRRPAARAKPGTAKTRRAAPAPEPVKKPRRRARKTQLSKS